MPIKTNRQVREYESGVKWPFGPYMDKTGRALVHRRNELFEGTVLAIDPATGRYSNAGYALFKKGEMVENGVIPTSQAKGIIDSLNQLHDWIKRKTRNVDLIVIEDLKGPKIAKQLHWSTGAILSGSRCRKFVEIHLHIWKALAKVTPDYYKSDENDAKMIGMSSILLARDLLARWKEDKDEWGDWVDWSER